MTMTGFSSLECGIRRLTECVYQNTDFTWSREKKNYHYERASLKTEQFISQLKMMVLHSLECGIKVLSHDNKYQHTHCLCIVSTFNSFNVLAPNTIGDGKQKRTLIFRYPVIKLWTWQSTKVNW